ncbi:MAG: FAD-binding oxidoreductase [Gammaproteobacteria bacterium]|nr:FAD-binding oxidoreductase [Gammaproteobacteria bacterium]
MSATRINNQLQSDNQSWAQFLPNRKVNAPCRGKKRVKFVVVGAGFTGLGAVRRLAEIHPSEEILLLDAREIGQNASGRNSGFAVAHSHFPGRFDEKLLKGYQRIDRLNQSGLDILRAEITKHNIECDWQEHGLYHAAADKRALKCYTEFIDYLERRGVKHQVLNQDALQAQLGTCWYQEGVKVNDGVLMNPARLVNGLADNLPSNVTFHENSAVDSIALGKQITLFTQGAKIITDKVLLACNYEMTKLGVNKHKVLGVTLTGSFTRTLTKEELSALGSVRSWGVMSLHGGGATLRLTSDKRIAIRNTAEYNRSKLYTAAEVNTRQQIHRQAFNNRFPQLQTVEFEHSYSCVEGVSVNKTNFFEKLGDNLFLAGGFNGSGVSKGMAFGVALAEYASNQTSELVSDCLHCPDALRMPPSPLLGVGARFMVRQRFKGVGKDR